MEENLQATERSVKQEHLYSMQQFNTNAEDFSDCLFNLCVRDFIDIIPVAKQHLQENFPNSFSSPEDFQSCLQKFVKRFYATLDFNSDILEKYLDQVILKIPPNILLPETLIQKNHEMQQKKEDGDICEIKTKKIEKLRKEIETLKNEQCDLSKRLEEADEMEMRLLRLKKQIAIYSDKCNKADIEMSFRGVAAASEAISSLNLT